MTIKNFEQTYKKAMQELQEISNEDLLAQLRSFGNGSLGKVFYHQQRKLAFT